MGWDHLGYHCTPDGTGKRPPVDTKEVLPLMEYHYSTAPMSESQARFGEKKKPTNQKKKPLVLWSGSWPSGSLLESTRRILLRGQPAVGGDLTKQRCSSATSFGDTFLAVRPLPPSSL